MANEVLEKLWIHLTVDFITKLPLVVEKDTILVMYNILSKIVYFVTIAKGISVICQVYSFRRYIPTVILPLNIHDTSPSFLQHILTMVMQQSARYPVFYDGDTLIELSLLWQSSSILLLSVSQY